MHGGINPGDVGIGRSQLGGATDIGINELVADELNVVTASNRTHGLFRHDLDFVGNLGVGGWNDLGTVPQIDLVPVISGRIVGGRHHDTGDCPIMLDSESRHRGRNGGVGQQGVETCPGHDLGGIAGEDVRIVTSVETDDDGPSSAAVGAQPGSETGSGTLDNDSVHAGRAGTECRA